MAAMKLLGQRWAQKHGTTPSPEWQRLLAPFAHLDPEQCAGRLVAKLKPNDRGEVWPPEMADVIHMLAPKPEDFGLPGVAEAYRAAVHSRWIHAAVFEAARRVGTFELANRAEARSRPEFEREYAEVCAEFMAGNTAHWPQRKTDAADLLGHKPKAWVGKPEIAKQRCDEIRRMLGPIPEPMKPPAPMTLNEDDVREIMQGEASGIREFLEQQAERYRRQA